MYSRGTGKSDASPRKRLAVCLLLIGLCSVVLFGIHRAAVAHRNERALFGAIKRGDVNGVRAAIDRGASPNSNLAPPWAVRYLEDMLSDDENRVQTSALVLACDRGNFEIVDELLNLGADPNLKNMWGDTPLVTALLRRHSEIAQDLLSHGALVNEPDSTGATPLIEACARSQGVTVATLLKVGANVHLKTRQGISPLMASTADMSGRLTREILSVDHRIDDTSRDGYTALFTAASVYNLPAVKELLAAGANINMRDKAGETVLTVVQNLPVATNYPSDVRAHREMLACLLEHGARN